MSSNIDNIVDSISKLTSIEIASLSKKLEEIWGVSAASYSAPVNVTSSSAQEQEKTKFEIILTSAGDSKINVIKEVRAITSLGLKEAKDLVDSCPKTIKSDSEKLEAEEIKKKLEAVGAKVELK